MATNQRAQSLGFRTPQGWDLINTGDNDISQNARAAVDLHDRSVAVGNAARAMAAAAVTAAATTTGIKKDSSTGRLYYAPAPVLADNFNRPDESPVGPTPIGYTPLVPVASTLAVTGNQLAFTQTVSASTGWALWDTHHTDGVLTIRIPDHGMTDGISGAGIIVRATPDFVDGLILDALLTGSAYRLRRRTAGSWESGQSQLGITAAAGDVIEVALAGPQVTVNVNGVQRLSASYPDHTTGTHVGVACYTRRYGVRYDDMTFSPNGE